MLVLLSNSLCALTMIFVYLLKLILEYVDLKFKILNNFMKVQRALLLDFRI